MVLKKKPSARKTLAWLKVLFWVVKEVKSLCE